MQRWVWDLGAAYCKPLSVVFSLGRFGLRGSRQGLNRVARKAAEAWPARCGGDLGSHRKPAGPAFRQPRTTGESPAAAPKKIGLKIDPARNFGISRSINTGNRPKKRQCLRRSLGPTRPSGVRPGPGARSTPVRPAKCCRKAAEKRNLIGWGQSP